MQCSYCGVTPRSGARFGWVCGGWDQFSGPVSVVASRLHSEVSPLTGTAQQHNQHESQRIVGLWLIVYSVVCCVSLRACSLAGLFAFLSVYTISGSPMSENTPAVQFRALLTGIYRRVYEGIQQITLQFLMDNVFHETDMTVEGSYTNVL
jgi:hypothetical protein